jgi:Xaa-Pro aminopeptidase
MLSADGCRQRRQRLWQWFDRTNPPVPVGDFLLLADPFHLIYLANFWVDPISLGACFGGYLLLRRDGHATLIHGNKLPQTVAQAHVDARQVVDWYDGEAPAHDPRQLAPAGALPGGVTPSAHDQPGHPLAPTVVGAVTGLRRRKDSDELALLRRCMAATDAGHAWARANIQPGQTERDVYCGVNAACTQAAGRPVIVYGDFAVSPGPERRGGPPTDRVLEPGDLFILDYSVVIEGYRSDLTNTLSVGKKPTAEQERLFTICTEAMAAGERSLRAGTPCRDVYQAVRGVFEKAGVADSFPHHAGHGLGLMHPEAPYLVRYADETLLAGDVITLEPGLYVAGVGGIRIERNYLVTESGFEQLSHHVISLT